jgi:hypothetical protein
MWLITKSAQYYPHAGTQDWQAVFTNGAEAQAAWDAIVVPEENYIEGDYTWFFIKIGDGTWSVIATKN